MKPKEDMRASVRQFQAGRTCPGCKTQNSLRTVKKVSGRKLLCKCANCGSEYYRKY